jgi:hypothetical protein
LNEGEGSPHNCFCPPKEEVFLVKMLAYTIIKRYTLSGFWGFGLTESDALIKTGMN